MTRLDGSTLERAYDEPVGGGALELVRALVYGVLNRHDVALADNIIAVDFRDHDPLHIPGLFEPGDRGFGTRTGMKAVIEFLANPAVALSFALEDAFAVDQLVAYRMSGTGHVQLMVVPSGRSQPPESVVPPGPAVLEIRYRCTGIFRIGSGQLAERWGPAVAQ